MTRRFAVSLSGSCSARAAVAGPPTCTSGLVRPGSATRTSRSTATAATTSRTTTSTSRYDPATDVLAGVATIEATATQNLSSFNLDLDGLTVRSISVDGRSRAWSRDGGELTVTPAQGPAQARDASRPSSPTTASRRRSATPRSGSRASSTPTTARSSPASRRSPRPGSRSTTTRATRPRTRSGSRSRAGSRRSPTACCEPPHERGAGRPGRGRRANRWRPTWPRRRSASSTRRLPRRRYQVTGTRSTRSCSPVAEPRTGKQFALSQDRRSVLQAAARTITVPAGGARAVILDPARHRAGVGLLLRRGTHRRPTTGRRCPMPTATRRRTPALVPILARDASVPRALPDRYG